MANETFANEKKSIETIQETKHTKKKLFKFDPNIFPPISGFRY